MWGCLGCWKLDLAGVVYMIHENMLHGIRSAYWVLRSMLRSGMASASAQTLINKKACTNYNLGIPTKDNPQPATTETARDSFSSLS